MPVRQLTAAWAQQATCPEGLKKIEYRDTTIIGFSLEVRASGGKTYYLRYFTPNGQQRQFKIGGVNDVTFEQARKKARTLRAEAVLGGDPMARKEEQKAVEPYAALAKLHIDEAKRTQRSWWSTEGIIKNRLLPKFGKTRVDQITPQEIAKWLGELASTGLKESTLEKYRVTLGRSYELGRRWGVPGTDKNPVRSVPKKQYDNARQRYLSPEEVERLRQACEQSRNKSLAPLVGLWILTATRKRELLDARWENVDFARRELFLPRTKNGKARHVPLSSAAVQILHGLPRKNDCPFVFPNGAGKPWVSLKGAWATAIRKAGLPGLRIHDLRHTAASLMINAGVDLYAVSKVLGHSDLASSTRYSHLAQETLFKAVEAGANKQSAWTVLNS